MTSVLEKERFLADTPARATPGLVVERALVPEGLLNGDEIVLLAVKPSLWFIPLRSGPYLLAAAALAALTCWLSRHGFPPDVARLGLQAAAAIALIRISVAMFQWASRLYVLTNRRVMRIKGVLHVHVFECPLTRIQNTHLSFSLPQRLLRIGSIHIETAGTLGGGATWEHLAQPTLVHTRLRNAIGRSHPSGQGM
jgi:membrane protein YdbS with pleckstrin-like domain